jgi:hypothetical protein
MRISIPFNVYRWTSSKVPARCGGGTVENVGTLSPNGVWLVLGALVNRDAMRTAQLLSHLSRPTAYHLSL